ncbi:hypothetical protein, partial [Pseudomonas sp. LS-2]|uniref:hypothetical protein n=1 Tax=Pseudomonas sp. LS-2 TaxID=2315859 RepID=UPI001C49846A
LPRPPARIKSRLCWTVGFWSDLKDRLCWISRVPVRIKRQAVLKHLASGQNQKTGSAESPGLRSDSKARSAESPDLQSEIKRQAVPDQQAYGPNRPLSLKLYKPDELYKICVAF